MKVRMRLVVGLRSVGHIGVKNARCESKWENAKAAEAAKEIAETVENECKRLRRLRSLAKSHLFPRTNQKFFPFHLRRGNPFEFV